MRDPWIRAHVGRRWLYRDGWQMVVQLLPAESLMGRADEGLMILAGLTIDLLLRKPLSLGRWRWPIRLSLHSDADEIATRQAAK